MLFRSEQGIPSWDRYLALSSRDYNAAANNLSQASRSFGNTKSDNAYERAYVGMVSGFDTLKLDYATRKTAAAGGAAITCDTTVGGVNHVWTSPAATTTSSNGLVKINVDNRTQQIVVSSTVNVAAGDYFTIANVEAVHQITKTGTGSLKTFRVMSVDDGTHLTISPPVFSAQEIGALSLVWDKMRDPELEQALTNAGLSKREIDEFWSKLRD